MDPSWFYPPLLDAWYLTGPTASGKSEIGVRLAERLNADIISMDSMAIYRGMNIGTAKPTAEQRSRVRHHLVDLIDPVEDFSVSRYVEAVHRLAAQMRSYGQPILLVGGTPLYLRTLVRGMFAGPPADWDFRDRLEAEAEAEGLGRIRDWLQRVDPASAARILPGDARRMIRALEVHHLTGQPLSDWQREFKQSRPAEACRVFVLGWPRPDLHARINLRTEQMLQAGLLDEVHGLLHRWGKLGRTAAQAVGYRECLELLRGQLPPEQLCPTIQAHSRQLARRQEIWFRGTSEVRRLEMADVSGTEQVIEQILVAGPPPAASPEPEAPS
jgi:tRNA dimethylallyltransferase